MRRVLGASLFTTLSVGRIGEPDAIKAPDAIKLQHDVRNGGVIVAQEKNLTEWQCACRVGCFANPIVKEYLKKNGEDCPATTTVVHNDPQKCLLLLPYMATDEAEGETCLTKDATDTSCTKLMSKWWDLHFQGAVGWGPEMETESQRAEEAERQRKVKDAPELIKLQMEFAKDLRDDHLYTWLEHFTAGEKSTPPTKKDFLAHVVPRCTEVNLRVFTKNAAFTADQGGGALTDVFGQIESLKNPDEDIVFTTYGHYLEHCTHCKKGKPHTSVQVGDRRYPEHPRFRDMREQYGVPHDFLKDKGNLIRKNFDAGSGSVFFEAKVFLYKCERFTDWHSAVDWRSFHVRADAYFDYMMNNFDSTLPRMFTAFYNEDFIDGDHVGSFCFVMQNWLAPRWTNGDANWQGLRKGAAKSYDFKGSVIYSKRGDTNSRLVQFKTIPKPDDQPTLKDLNFISDKNDLPLPYDTRQKLLKQIEEDTEWLKTQMVMDYSFFLQVLEVGTDDALTLKQVCPTELPQERFIGEPSEWPFFQQDNGFKAVVTEWDHTMRVYSMGLIDVLQPYSLFKAVGTAYDEVAFPRQTGDFAMNNIPPDIYAKRLSKFMTNITVSEVDPNVANEAPVLARPLVARHPYFECYRSRINNWLDVTSPRHTEIHKPICEDLLLSKVDLNILGMMAECEQDFTDDEVEKAEKAMALDPKKCVDKPTAWFVVGPASVGKTSVASSLPIVNEAVFIDGDLARQQHHGYTQLVAVGHQYDCVFKGASEGVKRFSDKLKSKIFRRAADKDCKQNLIIPRRCSSLSKCLDDIKSLKDLGYIVNVQGIIGNIKMIEEKGKSSASQSGKYVGGMFAKPLAAIVPIMAVANGNCILKKLNITDSSEYGNHVQLEEMKCGNMMVFDSDNFDSFALQPQFKKAKLTLVQETGVAEHDFIAAEEVQGIQVETANAEGQCPQKLQDEWSSKVNRPYTDEELTKAYKLTGFSSASCQKNPIAVVFPGPSKSTREDRIKTRKYAHLGIEISKMDSSEYDIVEVNGDIFSEAHEGIKLIKELSVKHNCLFDNLRKGTKHYKKEAKKTLLKKTVEHDTCKKNIVIFDICKPLKSCFNKMALLKKNNYTVHVVAAYSSIATLVTERKTEQTDAYSAIGSVFSPLISLVPMMSLGNGQCQLIKLNGIKWKTELETTCIGLEKYNPYELTEELKDVREAIILESGQDKGDFLKEEDNQGIGEIKTITESACAALEPDDPTLLHKMDFVLKLCKGKIASAEEKVEKRLNIKPMVTQSKGGSEFFRGHVNDLQSQSNREPSRFEFYIKSIHTHEVAFWKSHFGGSDESEMPEGYLVPFVSVWKDGLTWGMQPSAGVYGQEGRLYDIKGVPTMRYFRYGGVLRDPNWIADWGHKTGNSASLGVEVSKWLKMIPLLVNDMATLERANAVDYSILMTVYKNAKTADMAPSSVGKEVWPAYQSEKGEVHGLLIGGLIDYLENTTSMRAGRPDASEDVTVAIHKSPGVYACRMLLFVTTQMLSPCVWEAEAACAKAGRVSSLGDDPCRKPTKCVTDFSVALDTLFPGVVAKVNPRNHEVSACAKWDDHWTSISNATEVLVEFVKRKLDVY